MENPNKPLKEYFVWDKTTRWFHWINFICILLLIAIGTIILNAKAIQIGGDGKVLLKEMHVLVGYVFVVNLAWRLVWAFFSSSRSGWQSLLPINKNFIIKLKSSLAARGRGQSETYLGHNPIGQLMISLLILLLLVQATTGLVLAGTDIYYPPFGNQIAQWVTDGDPAKLANLKPGSKEFVDPELYKEMRAFRKPFITIHLYSFYTLLVTILAHITAVVVTEIRERNGIISAMFTGRKVAQDTPVDLDED